eukprot:s910_g29.t1
MGLPSSQRTLYAYSSCREIKDSLKRIFGQADLNKDGVLDVDEFESDLMSRPDMTRQVKPNQSFPNSELTAVPGRAYGGSHKVPQRCSYLDVSGRVETSFRVAGVALRDILTCLENVSKVVLCGRRNTVASFWKGRRSTLDVSCCVFFANRIVRAASSGEKVQIVWQERSTLDTSIVIFRGRRSTLDVSCCVFFANRIVRAASSGEKVGASIREVRRAFRRLARELHPDLCAPEDLAVTAMRFVAMKQAYDTIMSEDRRPAQPAGMSNLAGFMSRMATGQGHHTASSGQTHSQIE